MSAEDSSDGDQGESVDTGGDTTGSDPGSHVDLDGQEVRERPEQEADRAVEQFDEGIVDLLSWILDTETRARIYVQLLTEPHSTSDEIATGTGLYPSTVREALAALHEEEIVSRQKRQNDGAGNNPYEYVAIPPGELVDGLLTDIQRQLNAVCYLDEQLSDGVQATRGSQVRVEMVEEPGD